MDRFAQQLRQASGTLKGHRGRLVVSFQYRCECGWVGPEMCGKGGKTAASWDFKNHKLKCIEQRDAMKEEA